jgi:glycosyltransferase involved in cell wall biosynthesis
MIPVSVIVMTLDEAVNIGPCLEALSCFDQVFVVDSGSGDGTAEIAAGFGSVVVAVRR